MSTPKSAIVPWTVAERRSANHAPLPARSEAGSGSVVGLVAGGIASSGDTIMLVDVSVTTAAAAVALSLDVFVAAAVANSGGDGQHTIRNNMKGIFLASERETQ